MLDGDDRMKRKDSIITMLLCLIIVGSFIPLILQDSTPIFHENALEKKRMVEHTPRNGLNYTEIEIEDGYGSVVGDGEQVGQLLEFGTAFYLYNVTVYVEKSSTFPVTGNLTLEIQGVTLSNLPNGTIFYSKTFTDVVEGYINVPINGLYISTKIYVVTYVENTVSPSYYGMGYSGLSNDETTSINSGSGFYGVSWDQTMNVTVVWEADMPEFSFSPVILVSTILGIAVIVLRKRDVGRR